MLAVSEFYEFRGMNSDANNFQFSAPLTARAIPGADVGTAVGLFGRAPGPWKRMRRANPTLGRETRVSGTIEGAERIVSNPLPDDLSALACAQVMPKVPDRLSASRIAMISLWCFVPASCLGEACEGAENLCACEGVLPCVVVERHDIRLQVCFATGLWVRRVIVMVGVRDWRPAVVRCRQTHLTSLEDAAVLIVAQQMAL